MFLVYWHLESKPRETLVREFGGITGVDLQKVLRENNELTVWLNTFQEVGCLDWLGGVGEMSSWDLVIVSSVSHQLAIFSSCQLFSIIKIVQMIRSGIQANYEWCINARVTMYSSFWLLLLVSPSLAVGQGGSFKENLLAKLRHLCDWVTKVYAHLTPKYCWTTFLNVFWPRSKFSIPPNLFLIP